MKGINCILANAQTKKLAAKYNLPESIVKTIQQTVASERKPDGITSEEFLEERLKEYNERLLNNTPSTTAVPYYTGNINPSEDTVFVFGSNPEGRHGAGAAKDAVNRFGAAYGQGEGLQGSAYALPTKRIETHITPKLKGSMAYSFNGRQRLEVVSNDTIEAIINGERTATTRYESDGNIDYWSQAKAGDIVEFHKGKTAVFVRITKPLTKLDPKTNAEEWSKKEGWSAQYFHYAVKPKIDQAYQMEFEYVGAYGERTITPKEIIENIKKLYAVASENPNKKFKIGYRNKRTDVTLNGYSGQEMMNMFLSAGTIPSNIVFSEEWATDPYFATLYQQSQDLDGKKSEVNNVKPEFKGKLIVATPSTGKTTIADNVNILDGDYILSEILDVPVSLVADGLHLLSSDELINVSKRYVDKIASYIKEGKTVITARLNSLPTADYVITRESAQDIVEVSNKERANKGIPLEYAQAIEDAVQKEISSGRKKESIIRLASDKYLSDVILEDPVNFKRHDLQGIAARNVQNKTLVSIISEFLGEFGIETSLSNELATKIDVDILNRIIKAKKAEDLPEAAGEIITFMSLYHPKMKEVIASMMHKKGIDIYLPNKKINDKVYKKSLADGQYQEYTSYIGKYMGQILREEYGIRKKRTAKDPSFIDKLLEIIRDIIAKLKNHQFFIEELDATCRSFSAHILANNPYYIKASLVKPGASTRSYIVDPIKALDENPMEKSMIKELAQKNILLGGSLAVSFQGDVYRPLENPMHDLDFNTDVKTQQELEDVLYSIDRYKNEKLQYVRTQSQDNEYTYTYIYLSEPFSIEFHGDGTYSGTLKDAQGIEIGSIRGNELVIYKEGTAGKVLDFFVHPDYSSKATTVDLGNGDTLQITHADMANMKKIQYARLKDLYDYNRFVSNEFKKRRADKQYKVEAADKIVKEEVVKKLPMSKKQQMFKALDPSLRQYRYKRIAADFIETLYSKIEDTIEDLENRIAETTEFEILQTLMTQVDALKGKDPISAYLKSNSVNTIFTEIKEDYSYYVNEASDKEILTVFPTKNPGGANYVREQIKILLDNFDAIVEESLGAIEEMSGVSITLNPQVTVTGDTTLDVTTINEEGSDSENTDTDEDNPTQIGGGNSFKVRMKDNYKTLTTKIRKVLGSIVRYDSTGNIEEDDLGTPLYINSRNAHAILLNDLAAMITSKDFVVKSSDSEGHISYTFPALEKMAKKYSWVRQVIETLQENPRLIGAFYGAYRKDFIKRYIYKTGKGILPANETSVFESAWKELSQKLEEGVILTKKAIYGAGVVYKDKAEAFINTVKEVTTSIDDLNAEDKKAVSKVADKIVNTLAQIGVKVNASPVKDILLNKEGITDLKTALKHAENIATSVVNSKEEVTSLMNKDTKAKYINLLRTLDIANENLAEQMYRQSGKSYPSYTVPGYIETLFKKLKTFKGKELEAFLKSEFQDAGIPFYSEDTGWMNSILRDLSSTSRRASVQANIETAELQSIDKIEYNNWKPAQIARAFVSMFLDNDFAGNNNTTEKADYVWYNAPIFSDSPVVKFIKLKRYKRTVNKSLEETMMPLFVQVVKQELMRIKHIQDRAQGIKDGTIQEISNYDKKGQKLFYFEELNQHLPAMQEALGKGNVKKLDKIISDALLPILQEEFENWLAMTGLLDDSILEITINDKYHDISEGKKREVLWDYYLNQTYATSQIIQLLVTDPAYYKDSVDFQKRFKEVYAAGIKLNTQTEFGREYQRAIVLSDRSGVSTKLDIIKKVLDRAVAEGRILNMDRDNILNKLKNYCATDGQAIRTLPSLKRTYDMMGVLEDVEESIDRIALGKWDMKDFYTVFQTLKPFTYTSLLEDDGLGGKMRVGHQEKDSEFISLLYETIAMDLNAESEMQAIQDYAVAKDIDMIVFESGIKTGGQGIIDIYNTAKVKDAITKGSFVVNDIEISVPAEAKSLEDIQAAIHDRVADGTLTQEQANMILDYFKPTYEDIQSILQNAIYTKDENGKTIERPGVLKNIPTEDYCIAMSTSSEHLVDSETIYGTQFNTLIIADLTDDTIIKLGNKEYQGNQIKQFYQSLKIENLLNDFEAVKDIFKSPENLVKEIIKRVDSNAKYNKGIKDAVKLVQKKDPITGNLKTTFAIPFNNPTMQSQIQEIVLSIFKNKITKQKIKGGTAYLVSDVGFTDELQIAYKTDKEGRTSIDYIPCYLPCTAKEMFKDILVEKTTMSGVTYYDMDINAKDENGNYIIGRELLDLVGYRIPTEHKYSMVPLRVVGFLPQQNGSSIMLPSEAVIVFSGADYDIDKLFLMMYEYYKDEYNKAKGKEDYSKLVSPEISFEDWWKENRKNYVRTQPLYRKLKYDYTKTPEQNSRKQRNNGLLDVARGVLRHHTSAEQILRPQGFDSFIRGSALTQIIDDSNIASAIMKDHNINSYTALSKFLLGSSNEVLSDLLKQYKKEVPLLSPRNFLYYHSQNMAGGNALGAYANNTTRQAKYQGTGLAAAKSFRFNDRVVGALDQIHTTKIDPTTGEVAKILITQICCEGVGASADNAKQPTISTMNQHSGLIKLSAYLMSAGLSMDDVALFFAHPIIKEYINKNSTLDGLEDSMNGEYKNAVKYLDISDISITSEQLLALNLLGNNTDTEEQYRQFTQNSYPIIRLVSELWRSANALGYVTKVSRCDSTNGAVGHNLGIASTQRYLVDEIHRQKEKKGYPLVGLDAVPQNHGENITTMDKASLRQLFSESGNPMLQAFYTLGIEAPQHLLKTYFSEMYEPIQQQLDIINHDAPSATIDDALASSFLSHYVIYRLGTFELFRSKGDFLTTRQYYLNEFPKEFRKIVSENEDIGKLEIVNRLHLSGKGKRKDLRLTDANTMTEIEADRLRDSFDELLYLENPVAQQLAVDLFVYTYFSNSLSFLPHSLTRFFSPEFMEAIPGYIEKLYEIEEEAKEGIKMQEYTEYWYNNTMRERNLRSYVLGDDVSEVETEEGKVYVSSKTKNIGNDWRTRIKLVSKGPTGNTWSLLQLIGADSDGKHAYYEEVPHNASISFYNPDMAVTESIKVIEQQEEELRKQHEQEVEREAWVAGADVTLDTLDFDTLETQFAGIDNFNSFEESLASLESGNVVSEDTMADILSELEAFYPQDTEENERMC